MILIAAGNLPARPAMGLDSFTKYDFSCTYDNGSGDWYRGLVYAPTGHEGYEVGYTQALTDEYGLAGMYEITGATDLGLDGSMAGQVYVTSYRTLRAARPIPR